MFAYLLLAVAIASYHYIYNIQEIIKKVTNKFDISVLHNVAQHCASSNFQLFQLAKIRLQQYKILSLCSNMSIFSCRPKPLQSVCISVIWKSFERSNVQIFFNTSARGIAHTLAFTGISLTRNVGVLWKGVMEGLITVRIYTAKNTMRQLVSVLMEMSKCAIYKKICRTALDKKCHACIGVLCLRLFYRMQLFLMLKTVKEWISILFCFQL